jgi:[ribosomal protein S5]-alanine N-acetyltransferase
MNVNWLPPAFETDRLRIRPLTEDDAADVFAYASNPAMTRFTCWETHRTIDDSVALCRDYAKSRYLVQEPDPLAVILKGDPGQLVCGTIGAFWASQPNGVMECGYSLAEHLWGRGIAVEAMRPLIDYCFREYAIDRLQARVFVGNVASERVLEKLGFHKEGVLRSVVARRMTRHDLTYYSMLRPEWESLAAQATSPASAG